MSARNREIILDSRPEGWVSEANFVLRESEGPELEANDVIVEAHYLSVDPYMRGRMRDAKSYVPPFPLGEPVVGGGVGRVPVALLAVTTEPDSISR